MREPSSPSVKVTFTNREQILKALENLIQEWTQQHPELEQVILFGSFARGEVTWMCFSYLRNQTNRF